jgi:magnesium chelatase accessory protein
MSGEVERFLARATGSKIDAAGVDCYARLLKTSDHCAAALAMMAHWDLDGFKRGLPALAVPLHLIHGEKDAAIPASVSREVAAMVAGATLEMLPALGHLAHEEAPRTVAEMIGRMA